MPYFICKTCGTQFSASEQAPQHCPTCEDPRQYIGPNGQQWTTLEELQESHHNKIKEIEPGLFGIGTVPDFAIGQRGLLVQTPQGNVLWDCISLLDTPTVAAVKALGGISAIGISHPHFYSSMVEWAHTFQAPIYLHESNRQYVMRPDERIEYWDGETKQINDQVTLIRCGGHFTGSTVLHWAGGAEGRGALLTGDTITVVPDRRFVSFMYSYPNLIPLPARRVRQIVAAVEPFDFDRIYGGWWGRVVETDAKAAVEKSAERYIQALEEGLEVEA